MRGILREIREQPHHIREIFMWTMVVITFSVVGYVGFSQTADRFVAMVNPDRIGTDQTIVITEKTDTSPFAALGESLRDLRANLSELFSNAEENENVRIPNNNNIVPPRRLPLE